jgi:hypothetical protein
MMWYLQVQMRPSYSYTRHTQTHRPTDCTAVDRLRSSARTNSTHVEHVRRRRRPIRPRHLLVPGWLTACHTRLIQTLSLNSADNLGFLRDRLTASVRLTSLLLLLFLPPLIQFPASIYGGCRLQRLLRNDDATSVEPMLFAKRPR